ncbi:hypothetical protein ACJ73_09604 [Blastomyces percursus]|uniref:Chromo domain-containing protein n=1 Tax=Blastomyces percursus TaxID=1658174 RepID=A0A1J9Q5D4_9EURO|nr:hypothetical protein ACJ73_09604 [Blastomyces percursus]
MGGPWPIVEKIGNSFKVALPNSIKVHPVFSPDKLRRAAEDPLPRQTLDEEPPIEVDGQLEYTVNRILASRVHYGKLKYRVDWLGYDDDPVWYPASNFNNSPAKLHEFHERHPEAPGPPVNHAYWTRCYTEDVNAEDRPDDSVPENRGTDSLLKGGGSVMGRHNVAPDIGHPPDRGSLLQDSAWADGVILFRCKVPAFLYIRP